MTPFNRAAIVDENFISFLGEMKASGSTGIGTAAAGGSALDDPIRPNFRITGRDAVELVESQIVTRHLDLIARELRATNASFYTIGSAGHEGNAVIGRLTRQTDPAFLHYHSGGFVAERSRKDPSIDSVYDTLLSQVASSDDPISGGRHKVWGSRKLWILPQTSTIASHLPKAVGAALAIARSKKIKAKLPIPPDSITVCSFGDASTNHSTAAGAFNTAGWTAYQNLPVPVLFVCEDNGIGISVRSPSGYIESSFCNRPGITYFQANGLDLVDTFEVATEAIEYCRRNRWPVFLHLKVVRMLGHAGTDFELEYRSQEEVAQTEADDPLLHGARLLMDAGLMTAEEILDLYESVRRRCREAADRAVTRPRLTSATEVTAPLAPYSAGKVREEATRTDYADNRVIVFGGEDELPEKKAPAHLAAQLNRGLFDIMAKYLDSILFGEDVAKKGGVYNVTKGLQKAFRAGRVFNSLLDEQSILGLAQGAAYMGLLPIAEIQYLAYLHNAIDQIRGEACSTQFFSNNQFRNPMIVRIASLGYQKGFGGHFHNDNSTTALRDIPGLIVACPSRGDDAAAMLRTCAALAQVDGRVVAFLEPIALYMTKDLYQEKDGLWQFPYPAPDQLVDLGAGRVYHGENRDLAIVTYGNGVYLSLRAARTLRDEHGIHVRILDLRWLAPMDRDWIAMHAEECGKVLIVDEGRRSGGIHEAITTAIVENASTGIPIATVVGEDTYIPLGPAANTVLPSEQGIVAAAVDLVP